MYSLIQVIPTFGTLEGVTTAQRGTNLLMPNILVSQVVRVIGTFPTCTAAWR
jgi:hypothetical protein